MPRYVRVKNKQTGHEFDLVESAFNSEKYTRVDKAKYPPTTRPRRPKPRINLGGNRRQNAPVDTEKE
ncbi:hypothetical protein GCM10010910_01360 [Microbacterium nanhaiense]|uniref:Uncharacterized protein n=1 Tax=Microbacterium nanhaiense TaxID=1301026 RepID=A0ABQ2MW08_9MICO|nr:hypothetical protein [Microbacterium nanhaiense]GGO59128.1 hypothetical protein GCM10010910_01360 [Microbacterium nanhaiense]